MIIKDLFDICDTEYVLGVLAELSVEDAMNLDLYRRTMRYVKAIPDVQELDFNIHIESVVGGLSGKSYYAIYGQYNNLNPGAYNLCDFGLDQVLGMHLTQECVDQWSSGLILALSIREMSKYVVRSGYYDLFNQ